MLNKLRLFGAFQFILFLASFCFGQTENQNINFKKNNWFISSAYGVQISGIKSEDFVQSNVSPAFTLGIGKWISPEIALQIGYKGFYFHTIADDDKHNYNYIYGDVLFNLNSMVDMIIKKNRKWNFIFHPGGGYFYNRYYNRPNICANLGFLNSFSYKNDLNIFIDVSAIVAWDIYQGNEDILPSCSIGIIHSIK